MSTSTRHIDVAPRRRPALHHIAALLAVLSLPGSLLPWDWFRAGGLVIGVPLAVAAIVVGLRARRSESRAARAEATTAIAFAVVVLLIPVVWLTVAAVS